MTSRTAKRSSLKSFQRGQRSLGMAMVLPAVAGLTLFQFLPLCTAILNSFRSFSAFDQSPTGWAGLRNYRTILADEVFVGAFLHTIMYIVLMLAITIPMALALAVLLDRRLPGTAFARGAVIAALAASEAVTALIWNLMYEPSTGIFNAVLVASGLNKQLFLTSETQALICIVIMSVWKDVGLPMLIFVSGLQAIPKELHEAAALDGAGAWNSFYRITLPQLRPSIVLALFMLTITATRIFTPIMLMTQGGPQGSTTNIALYSYIQSFEFASPGLASASVVCMLVLLAVVTATQARLVRAPKELTE